jgi:uncharacterized protein YbjT (DUF2867 family)
MKRVVVTGAFSYTGAAVARELITRGHTVHTLTNREPPPGSAAITHAPLRFDVAELAAQLTKADVLVNTFWVRLPHHGQTFESAVDCSRVLIDAAARARVRLVHVSVSNAKDGTNLGYYRGKAQVEEAVRSARLSYAIVRPTLIVGPADVLTNNIAWFLRRFPLFPLPGSGRYRLQPITLADVGRLVADAVESTDDMEFDAAGPEAFTFADYVRLVARACNLTRPIVPVPRCLALLGLRLTQPFLHDIVLTREELMGLELELLVSHEPARGRESVRTWIEHHAGTLGQCYVNDLARHFGAGAIRPVGNPFASQ